MLAYETEYTAEGKTVQVLLCMLVRQFAFGQVCLLVRVGDSRLSLHSNKMKGCYLMFESSLTLKCTRVHAAVMCSFMASLLISSCMIVPININIVLEISIVN